MLKQLLTLILLAFTCLKANPIENSTADIYDVIIIGGGISGLTTISQLSTAYNITNTLLIEASDRLGGRIHTIPFGNNSHIELGAQVI